MPASRSISWKIAAASSGGKASSRRTLVTSCDQTKNGSRMNDRPGARSWTIVTMKLIDPKSDDVTMRSMPASQIVWPLEARIVSGGYDVQPDCAGPPGSTKLASMRIPARRYVQ